MSRVLDRGGMVCRDPQICGSGDGVLIGGQEEEILGVKFPLPGDQAVDLLPRKFERRVLIGIGEDGHDDLAWALPTTQITIRGFAFPHLKVGAPPP